MRIGKNFSAPLRRAEDRDSGAVGERGKGWGFVEQDKGSAVRHGIFALFPNELTAFSPLEQS